MSVTDSIYKTKDKLQDVPVYGGFWNWLTSTKLSDVMYGGVAALKELMEPTKAYIQEIVNFSKAIGAIIDPSLAKGMGQGVADVINACMMVMDSVYQTKDKLQNVPEYDGFWKWLFGIKI